MAVTRIKNNQITDQTITYVKIADATITGDKMNPNLTFNSNLTLNGNLTVTGNVTAVQSTTTQISDPLLTLALGNAGTSYDMGLILIRGSGGNRFLGWKENESAFVFINTTEDGLTSGNIATTAYSDIKIANLITTGSGSLFGNITIGNNTINTVQGGIIIASAGDLITLANNVVATDPVVMSSTLAVDATATVEALVSNTTGQFGTDVVVGDELSVVGVATVNSLVSNGSISGTTLNGSGTATVNALDVNTSGDFGTYVTADGGLQNTPIGNATPNTGKFTTVETTGAATLNSLAVNASATIGVNLTVSGTITADVLDVNTVSFTDATVDNNLTVGNTATTNILVVNTTGNFGTDVTIGDDLSVVGTTTVNDLVSNTSITAGTTLNVAGAATVNSLTSNGNVSGTNASFTTLNVSGTATVNALASNGAISVNGTEVIAANSFVVTAQLQDSGVIAGTYGNSSLIPTFTVDAKGRVTNVSVVNVGGVDSFTYDGTTGNLTIGTSDGSSLTVDIGVGTSDSPVFAGLSVSGAATVNALTSNTTGQFGTDVIVGADLSVVDTATVNDLVTNTTASVGTTLTVGSTATVNSLVSNGAVSGTTGSFSSTLNVGSTATVNSLVSNGAVSGTSAQFTTINGSGTATVNALVSNTTGSFGTNVIVGDLLTTDELTVNGNMSFGNGTVFGNLLVEGNLRVMGNLSYINVDEFIVQDPIIQLNTGPNGAPLSVDDGFDVGVRAHYYDTADRSAFFGRQDSSGFFEYYSNVTSETGNVITGTLGTIRSGSLQTTGGVSAATTINSGGTATVNALVSNTTADIGTSATVGTTLGVAGVATVNSLISNSTASVGTTLTVGSTATVDSLVSNGNVSGTNAQFTAINGSGTATVNALVSNTSAIIGTSASIGTNLVVGDTVTANTLNVNTLSFIDAAIGNNLTVGNTATIDKLVVNTTGQFGTDVVVGDELSVVGATTVNSLVSNTTGQFGTDVVIGDELSVVGVATVNSLISNTSGQFATDVSVGDDLTVAGTTTTNDLVSNTTAAIGTSATVGTTLSVAGTATVNALVSNTTGQFGTDVIVGDELSVVGVATVNSLVSNTSGQFATDLSVGDDLTVAGTTTTNDLAVNTSAVITTFASVGTNLTVGGNITGGNLIANNALVVSNISATGDIISTGGNVRANTGQISAATGYFSGDVQISGNLNVNVNVTATSSGVFYGNATTGVNALYAGIPTGYTILPNVVAQFTTDTNHYAQINTQNLNSGTEASSDFVATADDGDDSNYFVDLGIGSSTYDAVDYPAYGPHDSYLLNNGGNLIINADTAGKAINFLVGGTDVTENVATMYETKLQVTQTTASTSWDTGALVVDGGVGIAGALNVKGTSTSNLGNVQIANNTITAITTNGNINLNANGTGDVTVNSGLNNSRTVINGTAADLIVVDGDQVAINSSTLVDDATFQIHATDSMLLPVGTTGQRPLTTTTGMLRFNTSANNIEWWDGSAWAEPTGEFTVVVANSQTGNGSATTFTLPVANATTAGTVISINGIVQEPVTAYSITGNVVTFTEAPLSTDTIDFRVLTTTTQVTAITDAAGTTGIFMDEPSAGSDIVTFKVNGSESFSIQANSEVKAHGNIVPSANVTYDLGSSAYRWKDLYLSGSTIALGDITIKDSGGGTIGFFLADGSTPATLNANTTIVADKIESGTSALDFASVNGNIRANVGGSTVATFSSTGLTLATVTATGLTVNGTTSARAITTQADNTYDIGASGTRFATIYGVTFSGVSTTAKYADLAENYVADAEYAPGTVVEFGGEHEVTACTHDMCRRVAGVVSTDPAYLMNSELVAEHVVAVALQGRVPCRVTGTVRKGDLMVSAGNGCARAEADPKVGTVIGKALADFDGTEGVIEVVVGRF